jgi:scyllo-inositol 2-dehydrogenase (NADP+)
MPSEESAKSLKVVIVGYGLAGSVFHAPLVASTEGMEVAAIVVRNPERKAKARKDFPIAQIYESFIEVCADAENFDAVVIATNNSTHAPFAVASMKAGLPVVVDKPFAVTVQECEEVLAVSERTGVLLTVFQNRRWDNDFLTMKKIIDSGKLGTLTRFESRFERYRPTPRSDSWREKGSLAEGGGLLFDLGSHLIDQALHLFGEPDLVYGETHTRREGLQVDDDSFVAIRFKNGVQAHLWVSAIAPVIGPRFKVSGLNGCYEKYGLDPQEDALRAGRTPLDDGWGIEPEDHAGVLVEYEDGNRLESVITSEPGAYQVFYSQFRDAILDGAPVPVNPYDALKTMQVIELARQSQGCADMSSK